MMSGALRLRSRQKKGMQGGGPVLAGRSWPWYGMVARTRSMVAKSRHLTSMRIRMVMAGLPDVFHWARMGELTP